MRMGIIMVLLLSLSWASFGQKSDISQVVDEIRFGKDTLKSVFQWVAKNIEYDVTRMQAGNLYISDENILPDVLENRKGVCLHYAYLLQAICAELGYESYVISGYTIKKNQLGRASHAWNAVKTNGHWYFYDPTWSGGYLQQNSYIKYYNSAWYKVSPKSFIKTHIPFDPIWQLMEQPLTHYQIEQGVRKAEAGVFFNFQDSIKLISTQDNMTRHLGQLSRMIAFGLTNTFLQQEASDLVKDIMVMEYNQKVMRLNNGVAVLRAAIDDFNKYFNAKNNYFERPLWSDDKIRLMADSIQLQIVAAANSFMRINPNDFIVRQKFSGNLKVTDDLSYHLKKEKFLLAFSQNVAYNQRIAKELLRDLREEMAFINRYLNTSESARLATFEP